MENQYVLATLMFKSMNLGGGKMWTTEWKRIPKDHHDLEIRRKFPGYYAKHPKSPVVFLFLTS